jgi:hypothetical protein
MSSVFELLIEVLSVVDPLDVTKAKGKTNRRDKSETDDGQGGHASQVLTTRKEPGGSQSWA